MREHYGRGPIKAKTYVLDNLIVCVLTDGVHRDRADDDRAESPSASLKCAATSNG